MIKHEGYPVETHTVKTDDCYILQLHRIPHGKDDYAYVNKPRPVVLLQHGILCSSADWVMGHSDDSLGKWYLAYSIKSMLSPDIVSKIFVHNVETVLFPFCFLAQIVTHMWKVK